MTGKHQKIMIHDKKYEKTSGEKNKNMEKRLD